MDLKGEIFLEQVEDILVVVDDEFGISSWDFQSAIPEAAC